MKSLNTLFKYSLPTLAISFSSLSIAADKVTFQLDWLPGGDKAPVYVGVQEGFFAEEGIDVTIKVGKGSSDALTKLAAGHADIGSSDIVALLSAKANGQIPVEAVYSYYSKAPYAFYVTSASGINSVKDVAGKTIVTSPFTSENIFLPLLFKKNNVAEDSVKIIKADPGALNPMLIRGKADVMISWITDQADYETQAEQVGKKLKVLPWYDAGLEFYSSSIVASDRFIESHPDVVKRFLVAYKKAVQFTWENPEKSAKDVNAMVPEVDVTDAVNTINSMKGLVFNNITTEYGMGSFNPKRLKDTWVATANALNIDVDSLDPETVVNRNFISK
ncbi:ABC transporter substrate-binding protein [Vibrio viridaestus]|uniref:SsuA/THI5-like domain-containing protein n=1 Tax=Vibrio viridaestus TaxID=2487322 RepID=A0A3N9TGG6_9VIBR|nr:ABC transporter substrate-binding protein [Vibrio viridaestus]RQW63090.1 hypothetical protein EES38_12335 [Vibrio viridaestus]